jgi:hypothetical protein
MCGRPGWNYGAFHAAARFLRERGHEAINPAEHPELHTAGMRPEKVTFDDEEWRAIWKEYLKQDLPLVLTCTDLVLLPGWAESRGARLEMEVAAAAELPVWELIFKEEAPVSLVSYPLDRTVRKLQAMTSDILVSIIGSNSARHGGHVEWVSRSPGYHLHKSGKHSLLARAILEHYEAPVDGEGAMAHAERVFVRSAMALHQLRTYKVN